MQYHAPDSFDQAVSLLSDAEASPAFWLVALMCLSSCAPAWWNPAMIVDIKRIPGVYDIARETGAGALVRRFPVRR